MEITPEVLKMTCDLVWKAAQREAYRDMAVWVEEQREFRSDLVRMGNHIPFCSLDDHLSNKLQGLDKRF